MGYTKLFHRIVTSSMWDEPDQTRIVWITMLAMANQDGYVGSTFKALSLLARVSEDACRKALDTFLSPDPESRSKEYEGRRIEVVDGGWRLLTYEKHRDSVSDDPAATANRERQRRHREALRNVTSRDTACASASDVTSASDHGDPQGVHPFDVFWAAYPRKVGKVAALKAWDRAKNRPSTDNILAAIETQKSSEQWMKDGGQYIPHPATWLNQGRWDDQPTETTPKYMREVEVEA